jgi:hypothetical protein
MGHGLRSWTKSNQQAEARPPGVCGNPRIAFQREETAVASAPLWRSRNLPVSGGRTIRKVVIQVGCRVFPFVWGQGGCGGSVPSRRHRAFAPDSSSHDGGSRGANETGVAATPRPLPRPLQRIAGNHSASVKPEFCAG